MKVKLNMSGAKILVPCLASMAFVSCDTFETSSSFGTVSLPESSAAIEQSIEDGVETGVAPAFTFIIERFNDAEAASVNFISNTDLEFVSDGEASETYNYDLTSDFEFSDDSVELRVGILDTDANTIFAELQTEFMNVDSEFFAAVNAIDFDAPSRAQLTAAAEAASDALPYDFVINEFGDFLVVEALEFEFSSDGSGTFSEVGAAIEIFRPEDSDDPTLVLPPEIALTGEEASEIEDLSAVTWSGLTVAEESEPVTL